MKKKIPALILAMGMAAAPISLQASSNLLRSITSGNNLEGSQKRSANSYKRLNRYKAEKEYIREMDMEINEALHFHSETEASDAAVIEKSHEVVLQDKMPPVGIDISQEFESLLGKNENG